MLLEFKCKRVGRNSEIPIPEIATWFNDSLIKALGLIMPQTRVRRAKDSLVSTVNIKKKEKDRWNAYHLLAVPDEAQPVCSYLLTLNDYSCRVFFYVALRDNLLSFSKSTSTS